MLKGQQRRYQRRGRAQNGASYGSGIAYGVEVADNATFTNSAGASIYLGRNASDPSKDVTMAGGSSLSAGIMTKSAKEVINNGLIIGNRRT